MSRHIEVEITVNGRRSKRAIDARTLLVYYIREHERLTGTHVGCDTSNCGACTVLLDGESVKSCTLLAVQADGGAITTIEGVRGPYNGFSAVQEGFRQCHGLQCGYCTPGMVMAATGLIAERDGQITDAEIRTGLEGNLCRCTGYEMIVRSVRWAIDNPAE
ncbi:MAG: (2Fe-2S)-binding protein [Ilumatobacteraceae bacterium]|nr:(2Fe-2S)-binding protein [Ilumatobacteraceae bacterium]